MKKNLQKKLSKKKKVIPKYITLWKKRKKKEKKCHTELVLIRAGVERLTGGGLTWKRSR
jgi:hypothetical protein